jgi:hypothetical protein
MKAQHIAITSDIRNQPTIALIRYARTLKLERTQEERENLYQAILEINIGKPVCIENVKIALNPDGLNFYFDKTK